MVIGSPTTSSQVHGIVLAGGQGSRMGGVDKGLVLFGGQALAQRAALRLAQQVGAVSISANRHLDQYHAWGYAVWPDSVEAQAGSGGAFGDFNGPLAGVLTALEQCAAPYLMTVPCDVPYFPRDIVQRLADTLARADGAVQVAMPLTAQADGSRFVDPMFMLIKKTALPHLRAFYTGGGRKVTTWAGQAGLALAHYTQASDVLAFTDADTPDALAALEQAHARQRSA